MEAVRNYPQAEGPAMQRLSFERLPLTDGPARGFALTSHRRGVNMAAFVSPHGSPIDSPMRPRDRRTNCSPRWLFGNWPGGKARRPTIYPRRRPRYAEPAPATGAIYAESWFAELGTRLRR